jgi:hypothetical protein
MLRSNLRQLSLRILFVLWCTSWLPTLVGALMEGAPEARTPALTVFKFVCVLNALGYYVGGPIWLRHRAQQAGRGGGFGVTALSLAFVLFNPFGPVAFALVNEPPVRRDVSAAHEPAPQPASQ